MKRFRIAEWVKLANPVPGSPFRPEILSAADGVRDLGGMFGLLPPGTQVPYHYHTRRESIILAISGEAVEVVEGEEFPLKEGDLVYVPAGEKHMTLNRSEKDFRYLEFFTRPPVGADFVEVKE